MTLALLLGTFLAVAALAFVLYPLFFGTPVVRRGEVTPWSRQGRADASDNIAIAALREIEFDRATGKLSDGDYAELKERYTKDALAAMRRERAGAVAVGEYRPPVEDEIEAAVAAYRASHTECPTCGPRPEADAVFCSTCGRYLPGACPHCGRAVEESGARFCPACGEALAA